MLLNFLLARQQNVVYHYIHFSIDRSSSIGHPLFFLSCFNIILSFLHIAMNLYGIISYLLGSKVSLASSRRSTDSLSLVSVSLLSLLKSSLLSLS